jgi:hypothetical protein
VSAAARSIIGASLLGLLFVCPAEATQVLHLDTRALTLGSSDIVIGQVEAVTPRWNANRTKIVTDVTVRVSRSLKGERERIVLTQLGGTLGDVRTTVPGCPAFTAGEEALFFVWRDARGRAQVNGLAQGKFDIRRDPGTDQRVVQRTAPGMAIRDTRLLARARPGEPAPPLPLADLVREIERTLAEGGR